MQSGMIFSILRGSLYDGPGIRTTVFFKGCNLRCLWCHNPEGLTPEPQLAYRAHLCINCGHCVVLCPHHVHSFPTAATMSIFPLAVDAASARHSVPQTLWKYTANG